MNQLRLVSISKYDNEDIIVLMTGDLHLLLPRFKMFQKYKKHFTCCPKSRNQRVLYRNIERKLFKELHNQFDNKLLFDLVYNRSICILNEQTEQVLSFTRFRFTKSGLVPNHWEQNTKYLEEAKQIKLLSSDPWQDLYKRYSFEYFNYV